MNTSHETVWSFAWCTVLCVGCLLASGEARAQRIDGIGVRAGYASAHLEIARGGQIDRIGVPAFGVSVPVRFDEAITVHPELLYVRKGGQFETDAGAERGTLATQYDLDYLELAVTGRLSFPLADLLDAYAGVGPFASLLLNQNTDTELESDELLVTSDQFDTLDYGLAGELGIGVPVGGRALLLGVRYDYGLRNLFEGGEAESSAPELRTRTLFITLGVRL